jgi:DNA-binding MarR family transcriptional regulator
VLGWLALEGELCQRDLADRLQVEPPSLVSQLDRMEADGWIERVACRRDRRKNLVRPTPGVLPVWSKIVACAKRVRERATRGFDARHLELLKTLLEAVRRNLAAAYPQRAEGPDDADTEPASVPNAADRPVLPHANGRGRGLGTGRRAASSGGSRRRTPGAAKRPVRGHR